MQVEEGRCRSMKVEGEERRGEGEGEEGRESETGERASHNSRAKNPSSSSLRVGAGNGAPGPSWVGSLTEPESPKGFNDWKRERNEVCEDVLAGTSGSRRDQPIEFSDSRNEVEAILVDLVDLGEMVRQSVPAWFPCSVFCTAQAVKNSKASFDDVLMS